MKKVILLVLLVSTITYGIGIDQGISNTNQCIQRPIEVFSLNHSGYFTDPTAPAFWIDMSQLSNEAGTIYMTLPNVPGTWYIRHEIYTNDYAAVRVSDNTYPNGFSSFGYARKYIAQERDYAWAVSNPLHEPPNVPVGNYTVLPNHLFDGKNDFSVVCAVTPLNLIDGGIYIAQADAQAINETWNIYNSGTSLVFLVSTDGARGNLSYLYGGTVGAHQQTIFGATYHYITDGSSQMRFYINNDTVLTTDTAVGPPHTCCGDPAHDGSFILGGIGSYGVEGLIHDCRFYTSVITQTQFDFIRDSWNGVTSNKGASLTTVNTAPPSLLMSPINSGLIAPYEKLPPNISRVGSYSTGKGGIYVPKAKTNLTGRSSFESWAAGVPTGWTKVSGASTITQSSDAIHGNSSLKIDSVASGIMLAGPCMTGTINDASDYNMHCYTKKTSGTPDCNFVIDQYSDGACGTHVKYDVFAMSAFSTSWQNNEYIYNTSDIFSSWKFIIYCYGNTSVAYFDGCEVYEGASSTDNICSNDIAGESVCNASVVSGSRQLSTSGWRIDKEIALPVATSGASRQIFYIPGTSGNNNKMSWSIGSDTLTWSVYDAAGTIHSATVACAKSAHVSAKIQAYHDSAGNIWTCCDGACGTHTSGATIATPGNVFYLGGDGTTASDIWISELKFYNSSRGIR